MKEKKNGGRGVNWEGGVITACVVSNYTCLLLLSTAMNISFSVVHAVHVGVCVTVIILMY